MSENIPASGVCLEARLPLGWTVEQESSAATLDLRRHGNIALLRALAAIESAAPEREHDLPEVMQKSLDHLESKLDLVLLLVAGLARTGADMPPEKQVTLFSDRIVWVETVGSAPIEGQRLLTSLYLNPRLPQPLQLLVVVTGIDIQSGYAHVSAQFDRLDEELGEWLTRTLFRHHRRALHAQRQP